jgi:hypothetical protein
MFIGVFGRLKARIQSTIPKPGVAGSNPAEGALLDFLLYSACYAFLLPKGANLVEVVSPGFT